MAFTKKSTADVVVIGGGAAGMFASIQAARRGLRVLLLEKNPACGKKLLITGKGRCNVTNNCPPEEVLKNVPRNGRFLYSSVYAFPPEAAMAFFEENGCALKTERGNRVFPVSDRSMDVLNALLRAMRAAGVQHRQGSAQHILTENGQVCGVQTAEEMISCRAAILCTGGASYPLTGSTGDGFRMAAALGHTITPVAGSLVPLVSEDADCAQMQGLSLRNTAFRLLDSRGKTVYSDFGELLFTHFGVSGPMALSASAHMKPGIQYTILLDLKPALDEKTLDARILRDFSAAQNRDFENSLSALLPRSMIPVVIARSGIDPLQKVNSITKQQRRALLETIKCFSVPIACKAPVEDAIVTSGGVKVSEVNAKTMESKRVQGLYFAGELLDVDAYTGGFNLQIAWATGRLAGLSAAAKEFSSPEDAT